MRSSRGCGVRQGSSARSHAVAAGLLLVLFGRIFAWMFCADAAEQIPPPSHPAAKKGGPNAAAADLDAQIGWVTEAKDWAGELISGQTTTGRILVGVILI